MASAGSAVSAGPAAGPDDIDLDGLSARYRAHGRVARLLYIADNQPALAVKALSRCLSTLQETLDTAAYQKLAARSASLGGPGADAAFVATADATAAMRQAALEKEVQLHLSNQLRESIRRSYVDMAAFCYDRGQFQEGIKMLHRAKEHCTNSKQLADVTLMTLELALLLQDWQTVGACVSRGELHTEGAASAGAGAAEVRAKVDIALALQALQHGNYHTAATRFLCVPASFHWDTIAHGEEIASYAALCALAAYSRQELKPLLVGSSAAKQLLESQPLLRDAVQDLVSSRYGVALAAVRRAAAGELRLDRYLAPFLPTLLQQIRARAITQYLQPYTAVNLLSMAETFSMPPPECEAAVVALIRAGAVSGRVDGVAHVFRRFTPDPRAAAIDAALQTSRQFVSDARILLLQSSMQKAGLKLKHKKEGRSGRGGAAAAHGAASGSGSGATAAAVEVDGDSMSDDDDTLQAALAASVADAADEAAAQEAALAEQMAAVRSESTPSANMHE